LAISFILSLLGALISRSQRETRLSLAGGVNIDPNSFIVRPSSVLISLIRLPIPSFAIILTLLQINNITLTTKNEDFIVVFGLICYTIIEPTKKDEKMR